MQITIEIKTVYGKQTLYPVCDHAKLFASIAGTTTLVPAAIKKIKALGYEIIIMQQENRLIGYTFDVYAE